MPRLSEFRRHRKRLLGKWGEVPGKTVSPSISPANPYGFLPDRQGRAWRWEADGEDDWLLLDRDGRLAVHLNQQAAGWRVVHPCVVPEIIEPDLDAAKTRAQTLALASLPLHQSTRRGNARTNQMPPGAQLLALPPAPELDVDAVQASPQDMPTALTSDVAPAS
jgi:hypothetical protein